MKTKVKPKSKVVPKSASNEVLTLDEAAEFLRLTKTQLRQFVAEGKLPGRQIGKDCRFLRTSLESWLQGQQPKRNPFLVAAGAFKDDEDLPGILKAIYTARGRPEDGEIAPVERNGR